MILSFIGRSSSDDTDLEDFDDSSQKSDCSDQASDSEKEKILKPDRVDQER
jgi:hypothetical protein